MIIEVHVKILDHHLAEITFHGQAIQPASAVYPRNEIVQWIAGWLGERPVEPLTRQ